MHISIEGFDGVGKTTVSRILSERMELCFVEKPLKYLFDPEGGVNEYLRIRDYINAVSPTNRPLSAWFYGLGNIFLYERYNDKDIVTDRHLLSNYAWSYSEDTLDIFDKLFELIGAPTYTFILYATPETILDRLNHRDQSDSDISKIHHSALIYERMRTFAMRHDMPHEVIDTNNKRPDAIVEHIIGILKERGLVHEKH